jgi:hypothetical protein
MSHSRPPEIDHFNALLEKMLQYRGDARPAIAPISDELVSVTGGDPVEASFALFQLIDTICVFIEGDIASSKNQRAGRRLKERILGLFSTDMLASNYAEFQNSQKHNINTIIDLMSFLDHLEFDALKFLESKPDIDEVLNKLEASAAGSGDFSDSQRKLILAQVALIKRSLARFSVDGLGPFRESIFTSIGRLSIELRTSDKGQASAIKSAIDDLLRAKDIAEMAGGALQLTGPFVAGLLTGPAIG